LLVFKKAEPLPSVKFIKETKLDAEIVNYRLDKLLAFCKEGNDPAARRYVVNGSPAICSDIQHNYQEGGIRSVSDKPENGTF
jgi:hypothetical protein